MGNNKDLEEEQYNIADLAKFPSENPNPVLRVSKDKILYINEAAQDLLNIQVKDPLPEILFEEINKALTSKSGSTIEVELINKIILFNLTPIKGEDYINIYGRDITESKKAEQKLIESEKLYKYLANELELIIDHLPGIVVYKDTENNLLRVNKFLADAHNLTKEEMEGVSSFDIYPRDQAQAYWDDDLEVVKSKQPKINIIEPWESDLGKRWLNTSKIPYIDENGDVKGIIALAFDITERMKVEEELRKSEEKALLAYQRAEIYKDLFAHDISNILQNILSSMGLISMWQENPNDPQKLTEVIRIVNNQVLRGAKLITNIQKLSQINEEAELISVDPFSKLDEAIKFIKKSYSDKQIEIKIISQIKEAKIIANDLLLDIYENLLINSVKYNKNPTIEIQINVLKIREDNLDYLKFEVIDNGIGISDSMKEGIFKGTTKREDKSKGMGLGLLLVRKIILSYNGKIWVEDKVKGDHSQGTKFIILLLEVK